MVSLEFFDDLGVGGVPLEGVDAIPGPRIKECLWDVLTTSPLDATRLNMNLPFFALVMMSSPMGV